MSRDSLRTDRIADPWGERTPYRRVQGWPVRVDAYLEAGTSEHEVERWAQSASILHSNGDAMDVAVYLTARGCDISRTTVGQAAQGARDDDLLGAARGCERETAIQLRWLRTRMKQAAPQALAVS